MEYDEKSEESEKKNRPHKIELYTIWEQEQFGVAWRKIYEEKKIWKTVAAHAFSGLSYRMSFFLNIYNKRMMCEVPTLKTIIIIYSYL